VINRKAALPFILLFFIAILPAIWFNEIIFFLLPFGSLLFYAGWKFPQVVFSCLLFSLPFSFEYHFISGWSMDLPDEILMLVISFLAVACFISSRARRKSFIVHPVVQLVMLWFLWMMICAAFSSLPMVSAKFVLAKTWYAGAFLLAPVFLLYDKEAVSRSIRVLIYALLAVVLIILVRHGLKGFSFRSVNDAVYPFFRNHVNYSAMLVCCIPFILVLYANGNNGTRKRITALVVIIILPALFFSYARGAWLALAAGLVAWWLIRKKLLFAAFIISVFISVAVLGWLASDNSYVKYAHDYRTTIFHEDFREHIRATYELKDISAAERYYRWIAAVRMAKEESGVGFGPGTFYNNYQPYTVPAFKTWVSNNPERSTAHNYFLLTAAEQGIPGVFLLLALIGSCLWYAQRLYCRCRDFFYRSIAAASGIMLVMISTLNLLSDLIETDKVGSLFFLAVSLLVIADINSRGSSDPSPDMQSVS
jgi:O-antigen ligase